MGIFASDKFLIKLASEMAQNALEQKRLCVVCLYHCKHDGTMKHQDNKALVRNLTWYNHKNSNRYTKRKL